MDELMENEELIEEDYTKEKIDELLEFIKKERNISQISDAFDLTPFEILGLAHDLIDSGFNIIVKEYDDGFHLLNQGDPTAKENSHYDFDTDEDNEFKFVAISDVRLGSKSQQLSILNDIYKKAKEMGIKNVILCGNISAGLKPITDTESNFIHDTQTQIDYIVANYPKVDGITTYFISGILDDKHLSSKKINIGQRIADKRPDMIYLGEDTCDIEIDRVKMQVMSTKLSKTYTASYRTQQIIDSCRSEDKPDVLLYGGLLQMEKYNYRGVCCISTPSVCATDKEMKAKRYSNTVGAWYVTLKLKENGKLDNIEALNSPYYVTNKEDYKGKQISKFSSSSTFDMDSPSIKTALKLLKYAKNGMSIDAFMAKFHLSYKELQGILLLWERCNKQVEIVFEDNEMVFKKNNKRAASMGKPGLEKLNEQEILVVSDTHFGNIHNQLHLLNDLYLEAYYRGIKTVLHVGDLTDGNYLNRPESPRQQFLH